MNKVKKQHYVPRGYLKNFANNDQIWAHDKLRGITFRSGLFNVAQENYFYEIPSEADEEIPKEAVGVVEQYLGEVDNQSAEVIDRLLKKIETSRALSPKGFPSYQMSQEEMYLLSQYIVFQNLRTKEFREKLAQLDHSTRESILQKIADMKFPEDDLKVTVFPDLGREVALHIQQIIDENHTDGLIRICMAKAWFIGYNASDELLWTSDNPLIMKSHDKSPFNGPAWGAYKVEIAVPLSPKVILVLLCPSLLNIKRLDLQVPDMQHGYLIELEKENIYYYNHQQYVQSYRFLYSNSSEFKLLTEFKKIHPKYLDPYRQRVRSGFGPDEWKLPADWDKRHQIIR